MPNQPQPTAGNRCTEGGPNLDLSENTSYTSSSSSTHTHRRSGCERDRRIRPGRALIANSTDWKLKGGRGRKQHIGISIVVGIEQRLLYKHDVQRRPNFSIAPRANEPKRLESLFVFSLDSAFDLHPHYNCDTVSPLPRTVRTTTRLRIVDLVYNFLQSAIDTAGSSPAHILKWGALNSGISRIGLTTGIGNKQDFCKDSTLPVCNVLTESHNQIGTWGGCVLRGIPLSSGEHLGNLVFRSEKKRAAVGRREMQLFLIGFIVIELAEIFTVGEFPLPSTVRIAFTGIHIGTIIATTWILLMNAVVGFQILDDGTPLSLGLIVISAAILFVGTGYITLDTGFNWTGEFENSYNPPNRNIALYVLYQLVPLIFLVAFYVLEAVLVLRVLGEVRPMLYLTGAAVLFALGQIFNYVVSPYICDGTSGKIDGALFETLFTLLAVVMVWVFWSSITEDDWPTAVTPTGYA
ncbi:hypothetical protein CIB48_g8794 [Xylaria polymorpha]|nr:hypothetical protein CIB48_g8794 [Xylaria polymorpha]